MLMGWDVNLREKEAAGYSSTPMEGFGLARLGS